MYDAVIMELGAYEGLKVYKDIAASAAPILTILLGLLQVPKLHENPILNCWISLLLSLGLTRDPNNDKNSVVSLQFCFYQVEKPLYFSTSFAV